MSDNIAKVLPYRVDLAEPIKKTYLDTLFATQDNEAHRFDISLFRDKTALEMPSGATVSAYFIRYSDNVTISLTGEKSGNVASVTLKKSCYNKSGQFALIIKVLNDDAISTIFYGEGTIFASSTDTILDEENVIPSLEDLLAQIATMEAATKAANTATANANTATSKANTATTNANNATTNANNAAAKINGMTVSAVKADEAGAAISEVNGVKHIAFSLPKGDKGDRGEKGETGSLENMPFYEGTPAALGTASTGSSEMISRGDHVHPMPSASDVGALPSDGTAANASKLGDKTWAELMLTIYPVGSIYMSVNSASPGTLFGGTWERLKDRFLLGAGDTYTAGGTGGAASVALTQNQLPRIEGTASFRDNVNPGSFRPTGVFTGGASSVSSSGISTSGSSAAEQMLKLGFGNNEAHENMPPYLAVYMWKRVS